LKLLVSLSVFTDRVTLVTEPTRPLTARVLGYEVGVPFVMVIVPDEVKVVCPNTADENGRSRHEKRTPLLNVTI
jgi:hypothetical protein